MSRFSVPLQSSVFAVRTIQDLYAEIQATYKSNDLPWVIGYSGGKDSTATVQLIWYALAELPPEDRHKTVFVISSDTLVETPVVVDYINTTLKDIRETAAKQAMPFITQKVVPEVTDTFWVNLIGRGYPAPNQRFRWCTERLKIKPANQFVIDSAAKFGEVVVVLGARKTESMSRAQVMDSKEWKIPGTKLKRHSSLMRAYVYTPIDEFTTDDVWTYLLQVPSPWGGNNRDLAALYRSTQSGECPLVVDTSTPSCGNSRFGCWVCTVVEQDRTMQGLIDNGEEWMEPLLEFREKLSETQIPANKRKYRDFKRRDGTVIVHDGQPVPGPYKMEFRKQLLGDLLRLQRRIQAEGPDPDLALISLAELQEIRRIWRRDFSDWEDTVPRIHREVIGKEVEWVDDEAGAFWNQEQELLKDLCDVNQVPAQLVTRLIDTERQMQGMGRRAGIYNEIHRLFHEEWGNENEVLQRDIENRDRQLRIGLD